MQKNLAELVVMKKKKTRTNIIHFEISALAILDFFVFDESVTKRGASLPVTNHLKIKKASYRINTS